MNKDIIKLIEDALKHMGCPLSVISKIDANSPIVFSFKDGVEMNLSIVNDAVWLWSPIEDCNEKLIAQNGARFLEVIMRPYPFFVTGKMNLSDENGKLVLQGLVSEESLERAAYFAPAMQVFYDTTLRLRQIIKE